MFMTMVSPVRGICVDLSAQVTWHWQVHAHLVRWPRVLSFINPWVLPLIAYNVYYIILIIYLSCFPSFFLETYISNVSVCICVCVCVVVLLWWGHAALLWSDNITCQNLFSEITSGKLLVLICHTHTNQLHPLMIHQYLTTPDNTWRHLMTSDAPVT